MPWRIRKVIGIIDEKYNKNICLNEVCKECSLSKSRFCELFRQETHQSFKKYLKKLRIKKAKEFIVDETLNIKQISYMVGYRSLPSFCRDFKKEIGLTPSEYRMRIENRKTG